MLKMSYGYINTIVGNLFTITRCVAMAQGRRHHQLNDGWSLRSWYFYYLISNSESELKLENASGRKGIKFLKPFPSSIHLYIFFFLWCRKALMILCLGNRCI